MQMKPAAKQIPKDLKIYYYYTRASCCCWLLQICFRFFFFGFFLMGGHSDPSATFFCFVLFCLFVLFLFCFVLFCFVCLFYFCLFVLFLFCFVCLFLFFLPEILLLAAAVVTDLSFVIIWPGFIFLKFPIYLFVPVRVLCVICLVFNFFFFSFSRPFWWRRWRLKVRDNKDLKIPALNRRGIC